MISKILNFTWAKGKKKEKVKVKVKAKDRGRKRGQRTLFVRPRYHRAERRSAGQVKI
jgi:hypothetical protein